MVFISKKKSWLFFRAAAALILVLVFFQNCGQTGYDATKGVAKVTSNSSTTPTSSGTPTDGAGSMDAKGLTLGGCLYQLNAQFQASKAPDSVVWPMLSCDARNNATCAEGFEVVNETPIQMNCASNPATEFVPCYWAAKRCSRVTGSSDLASFGRGQTYGGCLANFDANFKVKAIDHVSWPMLSCDMSGNTICAPGFKAMQDSPTQMNCSTTPSKSSFVACYWSTTRCMRDDSSAAGGGYSMDNPGGSTTRGTPVTPPSATPTPTSSPGATSGVFCSGINQVQWRCNLTASPGAGWANMGSGCYHKDTGPSTICGSSTTTTTTTTTSGPTCNWTGGRTFVLGPCSGHLKTCSTATNGITEPITCGDGPSVQTCRCN